MICRVPEALNMLMFSYNIHSKPQNCQYTVSTSLVTGVQAA